MAYSYFILNIRRILIDIIDYIVYLHILIDIFHALNETPSSF